MKRVLILSLETNFLTSKTGIFVDDKVDWHVLPVAAVAMASAMMFVLPPIAPPVSSGLSFLALVLKKNQRTNVYLTGSVTIPRTMAICWCWLQVDSLLANCSFTKCTSDSWTRQLTRKSRRYSNCFMVLLNQRIRRDNRGLEYGASHELGVVYTSAISDSTATASKNNSKLTPKVESANIGELSNMQFAEPPVRVQFGGEGKASESLASGFNPASEATRPSVGKWEIAIWLWS